MAKLDDTACHLSGDGFPVGLPKENAATHIGCFVGSAIDRGQWGRFLPATAGPAFAEKYYPSCVKDYQQVLAKGLSSDYLVDDKGANPKSCRGTRQALRTLETWPAVEVLLGPCPDRVGVDGAME